MDRVKCYTLTEIMDDVGPEPVRLITNPVNKTGFCSFWLIFTSNAERHRFCNKYTSTWVELADRCVLLNYSQMWPDVHGHGLHLTTFKPEENGKDKFPNSTSQPAGRVD